MARVLAGAVLVLLWAPAVSAAHVRSTTGYSEIRGAGGTVDYRLSLESDLLAAASGHGDPGAYVVPRLEVARGGVACASGPAISGSAARRGVGREPVRVRLRLMGDGV